MTIPRALALSISMLAACGSAQRTEPPVEPVVTRAEPPEQEPETEPDRTAEPLIMSISPTCLEVEPEYILGCDGAPAPTRTHVALMEALVARTAASSRSHARVDTLTPQPLDEEQRVLVDELRADRCALPPGEPRARSTYWLGRLYYEASQSSPAAIVFDEVALDPAAGEVAVFAASLALDSLNVRINAASGSARDDCFVQFRSAVDRYQPRFCTPTITDEELCRTLALLSAQLTERGL